MSYAARNRWFRGLSFRLTIWHVCVMLLVFVAAAAWLRLSARRSIDEDQWVLVRAEIERHRSRIEASGVAGLQKFMDEKHAERDARWFVRVTDASGRTLLFDAPLTELDFDQRELHPEPGMHSVHGRGASGSEPFRVASTRIASSLWLQVGISDRPRLERLARVERLFWMLLLLGVSLGTAGGMFATRRALAPLRRLSQTSRHVVEHGDLTARVPVGDSGDELDELSDLFNRVLDRNQRLVEGMRQALDNVAHDLRTPLSSLRSSAELVLAHEREPAALREALADCVEESERVLRMLRSLMDVSEAESGVMRLSLAPVSLATLVREVVDMYQHVAQERGVELRSDTERDRIVDGDRQRLTQAVANLVDNAVKYTDHPGRVLVAVTEHGISVADTGIGIDPAHIDKIWQRLYRADPSRSRQGLGLGLSFVKAIVEAHGGRVDVESSPGTGSTFTIHLNGARPPGMTV